MYVSLAVTVKIMCMGSEVNVSVSLALNMKLIYDHLPLQE